MEHKVPKPFLNFLESRGVSTVHIMKTSSEMRRKGIDKWQDLVWALLQELNLQSASKVTSEEQLYREQVEIYSEMCNLRRRYEKKKGNDCWSLININRTRLANCSDLVMKVGIAGGDKRCEHSFSFKDKWFEMTEALEASLVDFGKCSNPIGCTCTYFYQALRDNEGRLISKKPK